ncbi:hypothetical protein VTK73DRAFT_6366 [Phialemonium thermophilum]|uniref:Uncharacterized protein n=1 Tax=Phialemonium thermophilum TaxID=223376 RepID=A0ABR3UZK7_9PEZI
MLAHNCCLPLLRFCSSDLLGLPATDARDKLLVLLVRVHVLDQRLLSGLGPSGGRLGRPEHASRRRRRSSPAGPRPDARLLLLLCRRGRGRGAVALLLLLLLVVLRFLLVAVSSFFPLRGRFAPRQAHGQQHVLRPRHPVHDVVHVPPHLLLGRDHFPQVLQVPARRRVQPDRDGLVVVQGRVDARVLGRAALAHDQEGRDHLLAR